MDASVLKVVCLEEVTFPEGRYDKLVLLDPVLTYCAFPSLGGGKYEVLCLNLSLQSSVGFLLLMSDLRMACCHARLGICRHGKCNCSSVDAAHGRVSGRFTQEKAPPCLQYVKELRKMR